MSIDILNHLPTVGVKTLWRIVSKPGVNLTINRDSVVVPNRNQFTKAQCSSERAYLVRNAFHQATISEKNIGSVVNNGVARAIELGRKYLFAKCHANGITKTLSQGSRGCLNPRRTTKFWVPRCCRVQLAKIPEFFYRQGVPGQVQQGIEQHRTVTVRQNESIAIGPLGIAWVIAKEI